MRKKTPSIKKNTPVILLLSGGMDSISAWLYLLQELELVVYPVVLTSSFKKIFLPSHIESILYFDQIFCNRFQNIYRFPYFFQRDDQSFYDSFNTAAETNPDFLWSNLSENSNNMITVEFPFLMYGMYEVGLKYAVFLEASQNIKIKHVFTGVNCEDGDLFKSQSHEATQLYNQALAQIYDEKYVVSSVFDKPFTNKPYNKQRILEWASANALEVEKTMSCETPVSGLHCGLCHSCCYRRFMYSESGLSDHTLYHSESTVFDRIHHLRYRLKMRISYFQK